MCPYPNKSICVYSEHLCKETAMPQIRWDSRSRAKDKPTQDLHEFHQLLPNPKTCKIGDTR